MKNKLLPLALLVLSILISFSNIGGLDIYALDEAKNAEAAREMFESGDYLVPYYNGELRTDKPPLHYYFMSIGYALFGVGAFGARFFSSLFALFTIVLTYFFVKRHINTKAATYSALVLLSSLHFHLQFHMSVPDPYLIFFLTWAYFSFFNAYTFKSRWALLSFYVAIGCGLLTKGPIALALPGISVVTFLFWKRDFRWSTILRLQPFAGVLMSLFIALPWYYKVHVQTNGVWTEGFFFKHNLNRFTEPMEGHDGFFLLPFLFIILGLLPFLPFLLQAVKSTWKQGNDAAMFALLCALVIVIFFSFSSTKLPNYTTPAYPLMAVVLGIYLGRLPFDWLSNKWNQLGFGLYGLWLIAFPVGIYLGLKADAGLSHLSFLAYYFIPIGLLGLLWWIKRKQIQTLLHTNIAIWIVTSFLFFQFIFPLVDAQNPVNQLLPQMNTEETHVIAYQQFNAAFVFALQKTIPRFGNLKDIQAEMLKHERGYVITRTSELDALMSIEGLVYLGEARDLFEKPTTLVLRWGTP